MLLEKTDGAAGKAQSDRPELPVPHQLCGPGAATALPELLSSRTQLQHQACGRVRLQAPRDLGHRRSEVTFIETAPLWTRMALQPPVSRVGWAMKTVLVTPLSGDDRAAPNAHLEDGHFARRLLDGLLRAAAAQACGESALPGLWRSLCTLRGLPA